MATRIVFVGGASLDVDEEFEEVLGKLRNSSTPHFVSEGQPAAIRQEAVAYVIGHPVAERSQPG